MAPGITIAICTYNGAELLPETIRHIAKLTIREDIACELMIVDNASVDKSSEVATRVWKEQGAPFELKVIYQPIPGLSYARELAIDKAAYDFILFCDDDNWLEPDYVTIAFDIMLHNSKIGMLGGCGELLFEEIPPHWARTLGLFASGAQAVVSGKVNNNVVYGAGCVMRRSAYEVLKRAGYKSLLTDRKGNSLSAGGDIELCFALTLAGYEVWYDDRLHFKHFMPGKRTTPDYFVRYYKEGAKSFEVLMPYRIRVNLGSRNIISFYLMLLRISLSYVLKFLGSALSVVIPINDTDKARTNTFRLIALKYKLDSFSNFQLMKNNFTKILELEKKINSVSRQL